MKSTGEGTNVGGATEMVSRQVALIPGRMLVRASGWIKVCNFMSPLKLLTAVHS